MIKTQASKMSDAEDEYQEAVDMFPDDDKLLKALEDDKPFEALEDDKLPEALEDECFVMVPRRPDLPPAPPSAIQSAWSTGKGIIADVTKDVTREVIIRAGVSLVCSLVIGFVEGRDLRCGRCGYASHTTSQCFAVRNIYGAFIPKR